MPKTKDRDPITGEIVIEKEGQRISGDIAMEPASSPRSRPRAPESAQPASDVQPQQPASAESVVSQEAEPQEEEAAETESEKQDKDVQ